MKTAEFEEKEYEGPLYNQLASGSRYLWQPGQVLEEYLGFDAGLFLSEPYVWHLRGFRRPLRGFLVNRFAWPFLPIEIRRNRLPRFRLNCFIQAKRPDVGSRLTKRLSALGPKRPYFKFPTETDQHNALEAGAKKLKSRALFTYAAAAFHKSQELFLHMTLGTVVENSTFPDVLSLSGHKAWYYNEPGSVGIVNQDFELLKLLSLEARIEVLVGEHRNQTEQDLSPSAALAELLGSLQEVVRDTTDIASDPRAAYVSEEWRRLTALSETVDAPAALFSFLGVETFCSYYNLTWLTIA